MGVCTIRLKVWNKDGYGRREYVQREMHNLKLKWVIGKMKWYTVDIKNSCFSTILSVTIGRDKYISVLFYKCELGAFMKRGINLVPDLRAWMPQRPFSVFGVGHLPKICTPSCSARCMTVYLIYRG